MAQFVLKRFLAYLHFSNVITDLCNSEHALEQRRFCMLLENFLIFHNCTDSPLLKLLATTSIFFCNKLCFCVSKAQNPRKYRLQQQFSGLRMPLNLKIIEDPKNFCGLHLSIFTMVEIKIRKLQIYLLIHLKIINPSH